MKNMKKTVGIIGTITLVLLIAVVALFVVFLKMRDSKKVTIHKLTDIEWYSEDQKEFTISTAEELYDLATLSDFYDFKGQTIKLDADIVLNEGNAEDWEKVAPVNKWFPIEGFAGIFDGQGHTISGVYAKFTDLEIGLFNNTDPSCVIQDFRLVNSYFNSRGHIGAGALAGNAAGTFKKIYTDAIVVGFNKYKAGFIGRSTGDLTMEECWFDGSISNITDIEKSDWSYEKYQYSGGFIGDVQKGNITLEHCLNTGLNHTKAREGETARFGGFIGSIYGANKASVVINDCFFAGTLSSDGASSMVATIVGRQGVQDGISTPLTITNTYATKESLKIETLHNFKVDRLYQAEGAITEDNVKMLKEESLYGVQAYQRMNLDFDKYWVMREKDVPTLRYFAQEQKEFNVDGLERAADMVKDTSWLKEAEGTADDPYILKDAADLYGFAKLVNKGNVFAGKTIKLAADIKVNSGKAMDWSKKEPLAEWDSIQKFAGTFDGAGYTISGLYYKKDNTKTENIGLFGTTAETAVIQNFKLKNTYFAYTGDKDSVRMGSVLGCGNGRVEGIYSDAIVENTKFGTGGLVGSTVTESKLVINNCWFGGQIKINSNATAYAGGIIGMIAIGDLEIAHCLNSGSVHTDADKTQAPRVGGIIGSIDGGSTAKAVINDCLNVGKISTEGAISQVSAIVGRQNNPKNVNTPLTLTNCFATEESIPKELLEFGGKDRLYQATGEVTVNNVKMYPTNEITDVGAYQRTSLDFDKYWSIRKNNTPVLKKFENAGETISTAGLDIDRAMDLFKDTSWFDEAKGTATDPYILKDAEDLYGFAYLVNNGNDFAGKVVKLAANIIVSRGKASDWATKEGPLSSWTPLKKFAGTFDGAGHEISGLYYKKTDTQVEYIGFFGETTKDAVVKNLCLKNSYFGYVADKDATRMGSIVGVAKGKIENVYSNAIVESNTLGTGGLVGATESTLIIRNCWFDGSVTVKVAGLARSGGILGFANDGASVQISHCLNSGTVNNEKKGTQVSGILGFLRKSTATITDCLNTGVVNGNGIINQVTALVGRVDDGGILTIDKSYATNECLTNIDSFTASHISRNEHLYQNGGGTVISENVVMLSAERIQGVYALKNTKLDFTSYWTPITEKTPLLMSFVANKSDIADTSMLVVADKTWFNEALGTKEDPYVLETAADLFGFAEIANSGYDFKGRYVTLGKDIVVNDAAVEEMLAEEPFNTWQPIEEFAGTFDGQGYTISGLYKNTAESGIQLGLFGTTTVDSVVKNVRITNSYFEYTGAIGTCVGSIAGYGAGTFDTIYSNAVIKHNQTGAGGIVGATESALTVTNCWYDGSITLTGSGMVRSGGIIGLANNGAALTISHCLNSGQVNNDGKATQIGGILGYIINSKVVITDCLNAGNVNGNGIVNQVTAIVGRIDVNGELAIDKTYATYESLANMSSFNATHISQNQHLYQNNKGSVEWENLEMLTVNGASGYRNATGTDAYVYTLLQFDTYWSAVDGKTPVLTSFVTDETVKSVDGLDRIAGTSKKWLKENKGTEKDPYVLKDAADLYGFASLVNNGNNFAGKHIVLANNITVNASNRSTWSSKAPINIWIPIGSQSKAFAGHFDGQGNAIRGIYETQGQGAYFGLFGATTENAVIENLRLENSKFVHTGIGDSGRMGSIVGLANGGTFSGIYSDAELVNGGLAAAGIVGVSVGNTTISNCWFDGNIKSTSNASYLRAAGIVGWVDSGSLIVEHCLNTGTIYGAADANKQAQIGGIVAAILENTSRVIVRDCLNAGKMSTAGATSAVSTIVGLQKSNGTVVVERAYATIESCPENLKSYTNDYLIQTWPGKTTNKEQVVMLTEAGLKGVDGYKNTLLDFDTYWTAVDGATPILTSFVTNEKEVDVSKIDRQVSDKATTAWYRYYGATGTEENPYVISNATDLYGFASLVTGGTNFAGKYVVLGNNISVNASGTLNEWTPIGNVSKTFAGHFDGQGYEISGLYQSKPTYYGLFAATAEGSVVENLRLTNSKFVNTKTGDSGRMGSIVALAWGGTVQNIYSDAELINGGMAAAGIVGISAGGTVHVSNCWFAGNIQATSNDKVRAGGIVGWVDSGTLNVEHCLNTGSIQSAAVSGVNPQIGGLVGYVRNIKITMTVSDSLNTGTVSTKGAITGVSTLIGVMESTGTVKVKNSYATIESMGVEALKTEPTYYLVQTWPSATTKMEDVAMVSLNTQGFASIKGESAKENTTLDFKTYWKTVEGGSPILKNVAKMMKQDDTLQNVKYVDVIIFGGQSNMQGQSDALTSNSPVSRAYEYKWLKNSLTELRNPVGEDIKFNKTAGSQVTTSTNLTNWIDTHVTGSSCYGHTNLVPKFCENYIEQTDSDVIAVHVAKGSTKIDYWLPGTPGYEMIVEKATAAIALAEEQTVVRNVYFVWLQGESDALARTSKETYKQSITILNNALKEDVGIDKFGVIRVGRFAGDERDDVIIEAQNEICVENPDFLMLTTIAAELNAQPEYMNPNVAGHYNAIGLEKIGAAAGKALGEFVKSLQ